ncbi:16253_t:CDS:2, partial [Rhizophagus irregularis]
RKTERDKLDRFASQLHQISHDSKIEREPNGKEDCNSISAVPIIALGGSNPD